MTGSVYNPAQMPPYTLPANANMMGMKSNTTKGGGGYNEFVLVDGKAGELIRVHAQKDMDTTVLNNDTQYVVVDRTNKVDGKQHETVKGNKTTIVSEGNRVTNVETGFQHNVVKEEVLIKSTASKIDIDAATEINITAVTKITVKVGASILTMDAAGNINLQGSNIQINGTAAIRAESPDTDIM